MSLSFPNGLARGDILLTNQAGVFVTGAGGGDIAVNAQNLEVLEGTILSAGIGQGLGTTETVAGDITLNAIGGIVVGSESQIRNLVRSGSKGNGGNITINSGSLSLRDGAILNASTSGLGNAGNVIIDAFDSISFDGSFTGAISAVLQNAKGQGGDIRITTNSLSLANGSQLQVTTFGEGNAGSVIINAYKSVSFDGGDESGFVSGIFNDLNETGIGKAGGVSINTDSLSVTNGAEIGSSTYGKGDAGDIIINANNVSFKGLRITGGRKFSSGAFSNVQRDAEGNGGKIQITTDSLLVADSAELDVGIFGRGNGGTVTIDARGTVSFDRGNIFSNVQEQGAIGRGGDIQISSENILFTNGAEIQTGTNGKGDAGNVTITARNQISFDGFGTSEFETGLSPTGIYSEVNETAEGRGGNINLNTGSLSITNGALLSALTRGQGDAGKITVRATNKVIISGSASNYKDQVAKLPDSVKNLGTNSGFFVSSTGLGTTGNIEVNSPKITLDNQGKFNAESASGNGGNITLNSDLLLLRHGSKISTTAGNAASGGDGGNIEINSKYIIAVPKENSDISANAFTGTGGIVRIVSKGIFGIESRPKPTEKSDITASSQRGISGVININTLDTSTIQNGLLELPAYAIDTNALIANSCISRGTKRQENSFTITGSGALPNNRPNHVFVSNYTTGSVRGVESTSRPWKKGDPIIEAKGVYRLSNGELLLSRECSN